MKYQQELSNAENQFNQLKQHAEQKLNASTAKANAFKTQVNQEISASSEKLSKQEAQVKALEQTYSEKLREGKDLQSMYNELVTRFTEFIQSKSSSTAV